MLLAERCAGIGCVQSLHGIEERDFKRVSVRPSVNVLRKHKVHDARIARRIKLCLRE